MQFLDAVEFLLPQDRAGESGIGFLIPRELPLLMNGSFYDPTQAWKIDLDYLRTIVGQWIPCGKMAELWFGNYLEELKFFRLMSSEPSHVLVKIEYQSSQMWFTHEGQEIFLMLTEDERQVYRDKIAKIYIDDYEMAGVIYLLLEVNDELAILAETQAKYLEELFDEAEKVLEKFEREKPMWREKIIDLIPESWNISCRTRRIRVSCDEIMLWWEISPGHWDLFLDARFDKVGYKKTQACFRRNS